MSDEELVGNMLALDDGLQRIEQQSQDRLILLYEDPVTSGAGQFVLYRLFGSQVGMTWSSPPPMRSMRSR